MIETDPSLTPSGLRPDVERMFEVSAGKIVAIERRWGSRQGSPVHTVRGRYVPRGWTDWTQGFRFGSALLQYAATGDAGALRAGREGTLGMMGARITHGGVHDHGFNVISTYGLLYQLGRSGRMQAGAGELDMYALALKVSGAVQAMRWTALGEGLGYIYSFNGPHSLFADTVRSLRSLAVAHKLGHVLMAEGDERVSLLGRLLGHAEVTARYAVFFGTGRDRWDVRGRVAHESIFNVNDGSYRCPGTQQGYSPFTTWTRGLAWVLCGFAEQLEFLSIAEPGDLAPFGGKSGILRRFLETATAAADYYIESSPTDGVPYWDTGAPGLESLEGHGERPADPFNDAVPVDSSAAAIAAQGLIRLGNYLEGSGKRADGARYLKAGLSVARTVLREPYLGTSARHEGLLLHTIYHYPNGWDHVPRGSRIPRGESGMWGDYHLRELGLLLLGMADRRPYYTFFGGL
jgi:hypothetical protein